MLHQLRDRVGRGTSESHCLLMYHAPLSQHAHEQLTILREPLTDSRSPGAIWSYAALTAATRLPAGAILDFGELKLIPGANPAAGTLRGTLTDADTGLPLAGVSISTDRGADAVTAVDGSYRIGDLAPGPITATASFAGYRSASGRATLSAGAVFLFSPALQPDNGLDPDDPASLYGYMTHSAPRPTAVSGFTSWIGDFADVDAARELASVGGIPTTAVTAGGKTTKIRLEHVWVEAAIDQLPRCILAYLIEVIPELKLDGQVISSASPMNLGEELPFTFQNHHLPGGVDQPKDRTPDK